MTSYRLVISIIAASSIATMTTIANDTQSKPSPTASAAESKTQTYTCEMHPEIVKSEPGKCPKCGMKLVPTKTPAKTGK